MLARAADSRFVMRVEDLDPSTRGGSHVDQQLSDLRAIGIEWDGGEMYQSTRLDDYADAIELLTSRGHTYSCYCSRREVREATLAAHGPTNVYPGTCRNLSSRQVSEFETRGRPAALRLVGEGEHRAFTDRIAGDFGGLVDDVVIRRNDGTPAYNLAVIVDDATQDVGEVVRGDDLLPATPAQIRIAELLGLTAVRYAHVPLAYGPSGERLAKRDGAVTLEDLAGHGVDAPQVIAMIGRSLALSEPDEPVSAAHLLDRFRSGHVQWAKWHLSSSDVFATDATADGQA